MRLSTSDSEILVEVWSSLKQHIDRKNRNDAAESFVQTLVGSGLDIDNIYEEFYGLDNYLDRALNLVAEFEETEDDENEEWLEEEWDE
tara:strand:- start:497 stop:760 length:264 start_codon:yes stop_codon:yes gene_type:complete